MSGNFNNTAGFGRSSMEHQKLRDLEAFAFTTANVGDINYKGAVNTVGDLPSTGNTVNDAYVVLTPDSYVYLWNGIAWGKAGSGGGGSNVATVFYYADVASFPAIGLANNLYYAQLEQALYRWNGAAYVLATAATSSPVLFYPTLAGFPVTGVVDVIYVDKATGKTYLWNGTAYEITKGAVEVTTTAVFPGTPTIGQVIKKTPENVLYMYDGTAWVLLDNSEINITAMTPPVGNTINSASTMSTVSGYDIYEFSSQQAITNPPFSAPAGYARWIEGEYNETVTTASGLNESTANVVMTNTVNASASTFSLGTISKDKSQFIGAGTFSVQANATGNILQSKRQVRVGTGITAWVVTTGSVFSASTWNIRYKLKKSI